MPKAKVTSFDVARLAGVSRATVSLVLNDAPGAVIGAETRAKVFKAAKELGYSPNSAARMLVSGSTETIALILSDSRILLSDAFVPHLLYGISLVNRSAGYNVLFDGSEHEGTLTPFKRLVEARRIDGMIVLNPRTDDAELKQLMDEDFPVVLIGSVRHRNEHSVNFSTREGIEAAVNHLIDHGHLRFGMVPFSQRGLVATDIRVSVLQAALKRKGLTLDEDAVEYASFSSESGHAATRTLLERRPDITAILAGNDTIAIGVLAAIHAAGKNVPLDISVIGFDDLPFARFLNPPLTTIATDGVDVGRKAAELLVQRLRGGTTEAPRLQSPTQFVVRDSTGPVRS